MNNNNSTLSRGIVKGVLSGDTLVITHPKLNPPTCKKVRLVNIRAPQFGRKKGTDYLEDEPYCFEARSYVRKLCIGRLVTFSIDYHSKSGKDYGHVFLVRSSSTTTLEDSLSFKLLKRGLARLVSTHKGEREYVEAEHEAKKLQIGIWNTRTPYIPKTVKIKRGRNTFKEIFHKYKNGRVKVTIEYVMTGSTMRILFPDLTLCQLSLTGIVCPGFFHEKERTKVAKFMSIESKNFTESKLLHRTLEIELDGIDKGGSFVGSVISPPGSVRENQSTVFQEEILRKGFGKYAQWLHIKSPHDEKLKEAEMVAKNARLRLWEDYVPPIKTLRGEEKRPFPARIKQIFVGPTLLIECEDRTEMEIGFSSIRVHEQMEEEAAFLLSVTIGSNRVEIDPNYRNKSILYCSIRNSRGENAGVPLIEKGLASLIFQNYDEERNSDYDFLSHVERVTKRDKKHFKRPPPFSRSLRPVGSRSYLRSLVNRAFRRRGLVVRVVGGTLFHVFLHEENKTVRFCMRNYYPVDARFSEDALLFKRVGICIDGECGKGFVAGRLWVNQQKYELELMNVLTSQRNIRLFPTKPIIARITEVVTETHFFIQTRDSRKTLAKIQTHLNKLKAILDERNEYYPYVGEMILAKYSGDKKWYRAIVERIDFVSNKVHVNFCDYGNAEALSYDSLREYIIEETIPPQAKEIHLAFVKEMPSRRANAAKYIYQRHTNIDMKVIIEYACDNARIYYVSLWNKDMTLDVASEMIKLGLVELDPPDERGSDLLFSERIQKRMESLSKVEHSSGKEKEKLKSI